MDGLSSIHGLQQHIDNAGFRLSPLPLATLSGGTCFVNEDHLWELTRWMPGEASFRQKPSQEKSASAMAALASFHQAAASYCFAGSGARVAPSPGLLERLDILRNLQEGELEPLWKATRAAETSELRDLAFELIEEMNRPLAQVVKQLESIASVPLPLQWCLRDVRHDHLLFTGEQVTGLIDFGAVAIDSVACDLARMLGSMVNDDAKAWAKLLRQYDLHRAISIDERRAVSAFDTGGTICSAANWVRWLFVEGRSFPQIHALKAQLIWLRSRLLALNRRSGASTIKC